MSLIRGAIGAVVGGLIGAVIWAVVAKVTGWEIGWIAWGLGALVGLGANVASGNAGGVGQATIAVMAAVCCLFIGKVGAAAMLVDEWERENPEMFEITEENVISYVADAVVVEMESRGEWVEWPEHVGDPSIYIPTEEVDYPEDVWAEATRRWDGWSETDRQVLARSCGGRPGRGSGCRCGDGRGVLDGAHRSSVLWSGDHHGRRHRVQRRRMSDAERGRVSAAVLSSMQGGQ